MSTMPVGEAGEPSGARAVRVVLADDDVLLREGVASLLQRSGFDVVGQAGDASELLAAVRDHQPDLAVIDIRMPPGQGTEGLEAARAIRDEFPETTILVLPRTSKWTRRSTCCRVGSGSGTC